ncbi:MAG: flagellar basal body rod protein FlgC [Alphaproteobacteria bacterium]|nr:flagellar basal body rod protein FlgC [Alphaproteobacteria bacterium]MCZ6608563.1 flagellar basal body rod protein FlgC [Alphaproteobacteria bacterium]MCZ6849676.1 flagellar basal body rod protein FlgC [Alphaproteobacteria bacterium]
MDILKAMKLASAGMRAQGTRMRVVAENLANADTAPENVKSEPYRRKMVTFKNVLDRTMGVYKIRVDRIITDRTEFERKYDPGHPAADDRGYVTMPNVKTMIELMDMKQAQRSFEANLSVIQAAKAMLQKTIDLLRA